MAYTIPEIHTPKQTRLSKRIRLWFAARKTALVIWPEKELAKAL